MTSRKISMLCSAALLTAASSAYAQPGGDYPPASDRQALIDWLDARTNIAAHAVVSVTPELVVAIVGKTEPATPGGPIRLTLREEVIDAGYVPTVGGRSSLMSMEIQCEERRVRMDERRLYAGANLGGSVQVTEPSAAWVKIPEQSIMDDVARAACEDGYSWPLHTAQVKPQATPPAVLAVAETAPPPLPAGPIAEPPAAPEPGPTPPPEPAVEPPVEDPESAPPDNKEEAAAAEPTVVEREVSPPQPVLPEPEIAAPAVEPEVSPPPETVAEPPAAAGPVFAVQIGAYLNEHDAQAAWSALSVNRPILVEGLRLELQPARVKGRNWVRGLVRDFATRKDARAFCTALAGTEYGCILRTLSD